MSDNVVKLRPARPCPVCGKPASQADHPFCSPRCADIDLNRWLSGSYVIPGAAEKADDDDALPSADGDEDED